MTLPTEIEEWANGDYYAGGVDLTKIAMSGPRVATGFIPLQSNVAAQELNEYLNRLAVGLNAHRDTLVELGDRVPGLTGTVTLPVPAQAVSGTYDWSFQAGGGSDNAWGWRVQTGDTAYFRLDLPPLARFSRIEVVARGIGTYSAPGWTGTIRTGQATPGQEWFGGYAEESISSGSGASDWNEVQWDGAVYSDKTTFHQQCVVAITAAADVLILGFQADFESYT